MKTFSALKPHLISNTTSLHTKRNHIMSMNKVLNFSQGGMTYLPPGFRFQPTDEEIVYEYLIRKTLLYPLPASVVPEITIDGFDPWDIHMPGDHEERDKYFFTKKEIKYRNGNKINRTTKSGYWKVTGSEKQIKCSKKSRNANGIMGMRKTLVFHMGKKSPNGYRTDWLMHEYRLIVNSSEADTNHHVQNNISAKNTLVQVGDWFLCHVFLKNRISDDTMVLNNSKCDKAYHFMQLDLNDSCPTLSSFSSSSSCGSSSITDVTSVEKNKNSFYMNL